MEETSPPPPRVLLSGDVEHRDFAAIRSWLAQRATVETAGIANVASQARSDAYNLIALCQSRPGQYSQALVESVYRHSPFSSLLAILGSWCEGELRSGQPWHGIERVYWYNAIGRLNSLLEQPELARCRTETPAERIERSVGHFPKFAGKTAVIVAQRCSDYEALADVCRLAEMNTCWQRAFDPLIPRSPDLVLLVGDDPTCLGAPGDFATMRRTWSTARFIAVLNFPRADEIAALQAAGCDAVLGKPLLLGDLMNET